MTALSRVDSNVHSESAAATHAMAILSILYSSSSDVGLINAKVYRKRS